MKSGHAILLTGGAILAALGAGAVWAATAPSNAGVTAKLKARLPKTEISGVNCDKLSGLCEVVAGKTLFYTDHGARYLIVGRVYDMETRQDLTAARLLEINPDALLGGAAKQQGAEDEEQAAPQLGQRVTPAMQPGAGMSQPAALQKVDLSGLPKAGAIVWGNPAGRTVTIFTDYRCGYCRALVEQLEAMNVRVVERPISVLGSRDIANRVYCAKDKGRAVKAAYAGEALPASNCDTAGLDANEAFARAHNFAGTPVIVRSDGALIEGFRPRASLEAWLEQAK